MFGGLCYSVVTAMPVGLPWLSIFGGLARRDGRGSRWTDQRAAVAQVESGS